MADGRDEVGAARDWLRAHGVLVPNGAGPSEGAARASTEGSGADVGVADVAPATAGRRPSRGDGLGMSDPGRSDAEDQAVAGDDEAGAGDAYARAPRGERRRGRGRSGTGRPRDDGEGSRSVARRSGGGRDDDGPEADPEQVARTIVLRKLTAQARTRAELERALRTKDVPEEAASTVLDRMGEVGLVDDAAFARDWVASRQQRRHLSRTALRRELQTKGVERDVIDEALADVGGADEHRAALDLARRKASSMGSLPREVAYRRLGGVLARRGFSASVTTRVLSEVLDGADHDD